MTHKGILNFCNTQLKGTSMLLAGVLASGIFISPTGAQTAPPAQSAPQPAKPAGVPYRNQPPRVSNREAAILESVWGIEAPSVKAVESGIILRFSYRVLDTEKAKTLSDKKFSPVLQCPDRGVELVVPSLEKVGQLRQAPHTIEAGKSYWMAFSNSGRPVKPGDHVNVVIGNFRVTGLIVE
jgi:hypothetical protein